MVGKKEKGVGGGCRRRRIAKSGINMQQINNSLYLHKFQRTSMGSPLDTMNMIKENSNGLTCISG
jgi:hypothetical protein